MVRRIAIVDNEKLRDMQQKLYIQSLCPVNRAGTECIGIEKNGNLTIDEMTCIGCGICPRAAPDAIKVVNLPEELSSDPIHRYGKNLFALYSLPTPLFENVVGILGVNGIGKSTAIKILARVLKPNLGNYEKEGRFNFLLDRFKGTEAQNFFKNISEGRIKISYKPQQVEIIPKTTKGKVRDLLKRVDQKKALKKVAEKLEISEILDNDINTISGGELQRVAIAATVLKNSNLCILDEPTSFLDIKQRIRLSQFIRDLVKKETSVMVVEHDLIILDYLTDFVNIMYGHEDTYGIVSGIKPTRAGINAYLSGYLKEENVRFRDKKIKFEARAPIKSKTKDILISWKNIEKKLGNFHLNAGEGSINKSDVIGVLGENSIGKTTFVKILANVLKQDKGNISNSVKVSYKPQYIETSDKLVIDVLKTAFQKYKNQIIAPLNIHPLMTRKINELSGGELQKVAIADCLQKDADLYLMDEPSAYLDSEQRLLTSKVIRDFMELKGASALVVDHDLLFIDYISQKLIIFTGIPAKEGKVDGPFEMEDGMNKFLKELGITLRRDRESGRPRVNKENSRLDREQKESGKYYYS